jgi:hypothetical protein
VGPGECHVTFWILMASLVHHHTLLAHDAPAALMQHRRTDSAADTCNEQHRCWGGPQPDRPLEVPNRSTAFSPAQATSALQAALAEQRVLAGQAEEGRRELAAALGRAEHLEYRVELMQVRVRRTGWPGRAGCLLLGEFGQCRVGQVGMGQPPGGYV